MRYTGLQWQVLAGNGGCAVGDLKGDVSRGRACPKCMCWVDRCCVWIERVVWMGAVLREGGRETDRQTGRQAGSEEGLGQKDGERK